MLIFVGIISHTAADAGYVLVIPLGGIVFYAAGRHPLAGIALLEPCRHLQGKQHDAQIL